MHFAFGLLLVAPIRQLLAAVVDARPLLLRLLALCVVATLSSLYELAEWAAALVVDPELGIAFVGAQGDIWDAQKDMALALGGAFIATLLDATRQHLAGPGRLRGSEPGEAQEEG